MRFRNLKKQSKKIKQKKEELKAKVYYANYINRIKAFITDMFMIYVPILYVITYGFMGGKEAFQASQIAPFLGVSAYAIIYTLLLSKLSQTPGKKAYTMVVVDVKTHEKLTYIQAFVRFVAFLFTATTLLGLFLPLYRKDKRALHDLIAGSVVLDSENNNK